MKREVDELRLGRPRGRKPDPLHDRRASPTADASTSTWRTASSRPRGGRPVLARARIADIGSGAGLPRAGARGGAAARAGGPDRVAGAQDEPRSSGWSRRREIRNARSVTARAEEWARAIGRGAYDVRHRPRGRSARRARRVRRAAAALLAAGFVAWKGARAGRAGRGGGGARRWALSLEAVLPVEPFPPRATGTCTSSAKTAPTPDRFPRRPGMARKRPLA